MARIDDYTLIDVRYPEIARIKFGIGTSDFQGKTTDDLPEGLKNLYWTQARFNVAFAAAGGGSGGVPTTRAINTTAPLMGGGDLSVDRTHFMPQASAVQDGYLSAADFAAFSAGSSGDDTLTWMNL
jgi:hypothetical protein